MNEYAFIAVILVFLIIGGVATVLVGSTNNKETEFTFNVVGVTNSTNASTAASMHFECVKWCVENIHSSEYQQRKCWAECEKLGKECGS